MYEALSAMSTLPPAWTWVEDESPHPELTVLLYNSSFPLYFLSCWQLLQQTGPSREHQPSE